MNRQSPASLLALALAIAPLPAPALAQTRIEGIVGDLSSLIRIDADPIDDAGANLDVKAPVEGAAVYVNRVFAGPTDYSATSLKPGSYLIEVEAAGYRSLSLSIELADMTHYAIYFDMEPIYGRLELRLEPPDAEASIDETTGFGAGSVALPAGSYELRVRRFGYVEQTKRVRIKENETTLVRVELEESPFGISDLRSTRPVFNPRNAGATGRTEIAFSATNYGSARASIIAGDGSAVAVLDYPNIATWKQGAEWNGRREDGSILPDGEYLVRLEAKPRDGVALAATEPGAGPENVLIAEARFSIDSSVLVRSFGSAGAVPGLLFFPDPKAQPAGTSATELSWTSPLESVELSAFDLSTAISLGGGSVLSVSAATELAAGADALDASASFLLGREIGSALPLGAALFLRASWSNAAEPAMSGSRSGLEASIPLSIGYGSFRFGLSPGFLLDLSGDSPSAGAIARSALWVEGRDFRAGLSGELAFGKSAGGGEEGSFGLEWPARASAEARFMLSPSPLIASAYFLAELEPGALPRLGAGLGLGLFF